MEIFTEEQIKKGLNAAYKKAGHNAYFGEGFRAGIEFANQAETLPIDSGIECSEIYCMHDSEDSEIFCAFDDKERAELEHKETYAPYQIVKLYHGKRK